MPSGDRGRVVTTGREEKKGQFSLTLVFVLWNSKCQVRSETSGLSGDFLGKIFCWNRPRHDMVAVPAPRASQPIPSPVVSAYQPLVLPQMAQCPIPHWHTTNSVCTLVFNDKGGKLTLGPLPHKLATP